MKRFVNSGAEIRVLMASSSTWITARQSGHAEIDISAPCDPSPLVSSPSLNFLCVCVSNRICCCQSSAWPVCFQLPALHKETSLTPQLITSVLTERLYLQGRRKSAGDGDPAHSDLTFCGLAAALVFLPLFPRNRLYGFILTYPTCTNADFLHLKELTEKSRGWNWITHELPVDVSEKRVAHDVGKARLRVAAQALLGILWEWEREEGERRWETMVEGKDNKSNTREERWRKWEERIGKESGYMPVRGGTATGLSDPLLPCWGTLWGRWQLWLTTSVGFWSVFPILLQEVTEKGSRGGQEEERMRWCQHCCCYEFNPAGYARSSPRYEAFC